MAIATSDDGLRATSQQTHRVSTSDGIRKEGIGVEGFVYIDVNYYNIRDLYERNLIIVSFIPSVDIVADSLIKPFIKDKHKTFKQ